MFYNSTRGASDRVTSAQAIAQGISEDGGLFVPQSLPSLTEGDFERLSAMDYNGRAADILGRFLTDFTAEEINAGVLAAYGGGKFDVGNPAFIKRMTDGVYMLELWHGPTCAFKDMALQLLPQLLTRAAKKTAPGKTTAILVATSGDTGKAALEGFRDVDGTKVIVFYPGDGVSLLQKTQMVTQEGENVRVFAIKGNFDDAQTGVKKIFTDADTKALLDKNGIRLSSANSINWGRLAPQIVYYISAYCDLISSGAVEKGGFINVAVPTGNFGNILAAYYAREMGVPIAKLICASNRNNVLTDFINTGVYDRNRDFYVTCSPSMDILISSNLERLLYSLEDRDAAAVRAYMSFLSETGKYEVSASCKEKISRLFYAGYLDDAGTLRVIRECFEKYGYLCDTHTAVAAGVYSKYTAETGDKTPVIIASTASPYKFPGSVLSALGEDVPRDEFDRLDALCAKSGVKVPPSLARLRIKPVRFEDTCAPDGMRDAVLGYLLG